MFDDQILDSYIKNFLGYGNPNGEICFVGLEEGIGISENDLKKNPTLAFTEVNSKINFWKNRGEKQLEDCKEYHLKFDNQWHNNSVNKIQSTWSGPIRTLLSYENKPITKSSMIDFQINRLFRAQDNNAMIELRPLPNKNLSNSTWFYSQFTEMNYLKSRNAYESQITEERIKTLKKFFEVKKFKHVIFLSISKKVKKFWQEISQNEFLDIDQDYYPTKDNKFIMTHHPTSYPKNDSLKSLNLDDVFVNLGVYLKKIKQK